MAIIAGKGGGEIIVDTMKGKRDVNEFKIAELTKIDVNAIRNIFYKLYAKGLASFSRKKEKRGKRRGWYIYYWTFHEDKAIEKLLEHKEKELYALKHQLSSKETKHFYACVEGCVKMSEETALAHNFFCPECHQLLKLASSEKEISETKQKIAKTEREIVTAKKELEKIKAEIEKKEKRSEKTKAKKKIKESKFRRKERRKERGKLRIKKAKRKKRKKKILKKRASKKRKNKN